MPAQIENALNLLHDQLGEGTVAELIEIYLSNSQAQITQMQDALSRHDLAKLGATAHSLKSSSANLGATELANACLKLEELSHPTANTERKIEDAHALYPALRQLHTEATAIMSAWQKPSAL